VSQVKSSAPPPTPAPAGKHQNFCRLAARYIIAATAPPARIRLAFDIETDGLLETATKVHCIVITDLDSDHIEEFGPNQIDTALARFSAATYLVGHNILGFDLPVLRRLYRWAPAPTCRIIDTLIAGRLILANVRELDMQAEAMGDPPLGKLNGRFSLEAWGARLGIPKLGTDIETWSEWTPEMQERCVGDARLTKALWQFLQPDGQSSEALTLEHSVSMICERITMDGIPFDREAAGQLRNQWTARRKQLELRLQQQFPRLTNLNSRQQIARLLEERGWVPEERTEKTGQAKIDDETLEDVVQKYPEFDGLAEHYVLGRRLGQLANGNKAWLSRIGPDQRIHGGLIHIGTPHHRAKHLDPNLAQVPNPKKGKPLASECRALFRAGNGWMFVTCDQAGLQDRAFAHYLAAFDDGAYARAFVGGLDTHWASVQALGLVPTGTARDKGDKFHAALREGAKSFRYGFLFGAQPKRAGIIIRNTIRNAIVVNPNSDLLQRFFAGTAHPNEQTLTRVGGSAKNRFEAATPGLRQLRESLSRQANQYGWLPGLDGRRIPVRALYTVLNYAVTSAEAIICKHWLAAVYGELHARFRYGWDGDVAIVAWTHDEIACCCRPEIANQVGELMVRHARAAGEHFAFKCPLDADFVVGRSWAGEPIDDAKVPEPPENPELEILSGANVELATAEADNPAPTQRDDADLLDELLIESTANLEAPRVCAYCQSQIAAGADCMDTHAGSWLHPDCFGPFARRRFAEEGLPWETQAKSTTADVRPLWTTPTIPEVASGTAEFTAIVTALRPNDRAIVWPAETGRGNGADRSDAPASVKANGGGATANSSTPLDRAKWLIEQLNGDLETGKCLCPVPEHGDRTPNFKVELTKFSARGDPLFTCNRCPQDKVLAALAAKGCWPIPVAARPNGHAQSQQPQTHKPIDPKGIYEALRALAQPHELVAGYFQSRKLRGAPESALVALFSPFNKQMRQPGIWFCVRDRAENLTGLHVIWLDSTLTTKRDAEPRKQSFGKIKGNFILLGTIDPGKPLIIAEGVETAQAVMQITGLPAALVGCGSTTKDVGPPNHSAGFIIAGDHDA
jgi:DNA polymerase I-like protein with 3'-5' exonuclease and polymerase domains